MAVQVAFVWLKVSRLHDSLCKISINHLDLNLTELLNQIDLDFGVDDAFSYFSSSDSE